MEHTGTTGINIPNVYTFIARSLQPGGAQQGTPKNNGEPGINYMANTDNNLATSMERHGQAQYYVAIMMRAADPAFNRANPLYKQEEDLESQIAITTPIEKRRSDREFMESDPKQVYADQSSKFTAANDNDSDKSNKNSYTDKYDEEKYGDKPKYDAEKVSKKQKKSSEDYRVRAIASAVEKALGKLDKVYMEDISESKEDSDLFSSDESNIAAVVYDVMKRVDYMSSGSAIAYAAVVPGLSSDQPYEGSSNGAEISYGSVDYVDFSNYAQLPNNYDVADVALRPANQNRTPEEQHIDLEARLVA